MKESKTIALRLQMTLIFIDLKVLLLLIFMGDFYRKTALGAEVLNGKRVLFNEALRYCWEDIGSPYLKWIPLAIIGDFILKIILEALIDD